MILANKSFLRKNTVQALADNTVYDKAYNDNDNKDYIDIVNEYSNDSDDDD